MLYFYYKKLIDITIIALGICSDVVRNSVINNISTTKFGRYILCNFFKWK